MIDRNQGFELLNKYLKNENLLKHSLAVEAILKDMALYLNEDQELWGLVGLLHDMDYNYTKEDPEKHAVMASQILEGLTPKEVTQAIKAHNYQHTNQVPETFLDKSLIAADTVSGLVIATALVIPTKKLADVELRTLLNKFKDKSFAKRCNRRKIELCEDVGIELKDFLKMSLESLKKISDQLGL
jgi:putative nucleotidyltransferase with HDIG domain